MIYGRTRTSSPSRMGWIPEEETMNRMRQRVSVVLIAGLGILGAVAPSAFGAANPQPGEVGASASSNARDPEARPLGLNVVSFTAHLREPDCGE
jgi:hypothetical protein